MASTAMVPPSPARARATRPSAIWLPRVTRTCSGLAGTPRTSRTRSAILALPLEEVSAKIRVGPPVDDEEDLAVPVWAGVVPISLQAGVPESDGPGAHVLDPPLLPRAVRQGSTR